jgi:hypothetical protein
MQIPVGLPASILALFNDDPNPSTVQGRLRLLVRIEVARFGMRLAGRMKRRWRVVLLRNKGEILGQVEAHDVASAKAAAAVQFGRNPARPHHGAGLGLRVVPSGQCIGKPLAIILGTRTGSRLIQPDRAKSNLARRTIPSLASCLIRLSM